MALYNRFCILTRVSKFSKNLFHKIFEAHSKIIYFRKILTIFIIICAKFFNKFSRKWKFSQKCSAPVAHISTWYGQETDKLVSHIAWHKYTQEFVNTYITEGYRKNRDFWFCPNRLSSICVRLQCNKETNFIFDDLL